jgi:hypothetical protein
VNDDIKLSKARFALPVDVAGAGMVDKLDLTVDAETGKARFEGAMTLLAGGLWVRISTAAGATMVPSSNVTSARVLLVDRLEASKAAKANKSVK